jgi:hypothetical protein
VAVAHSSAYSWTAVPLVIVNLAYVHTQREMNGTKKGDPKAAPISLRPLCARRTP